MQRGGKCRLAICRFGTLKSLCLRCDSRIGFEASNHYDYTENARVVKILNCDQVREKLNG